MNKNIDELALEIVELQEKLEKVKRNNKIANLRCNLSKIKAIIKIGVAISIVPTTGTIISLVNGWNPYKLNYIEKPAIVQTYIDKDGKIEETKGYDLENKSYIYYYSNWKQNNEGNYKRYIYKYPIQEDDCTKILDLINYETELSDSKLRELFNFKNELIPEIEYRGYVSEEELKRNDYVEGLISTTNNEDVIIAQESIYEHTCSLFLKILFQIMAMFIEVGILADIHFFKNIAKAFNNQPETKGEDEIKRKLKAKMLILEKLPLDIERHQEFDKQLEQEKSKKLMKRL